MTVIHQIMTTNPSTEEELLSGLSDDDLVEKLRLVQDELRRRGKQLQRGKEVKREEEDEDEITHIVNIQPTLTPPTHQTLHLWLLLADSALPIGSFAFSSGLESYIAHRNLRTTSTNTTTPNPNSNKPSSPRAEVDRFLSLSLLSIASTVVPFITACFLHPEHVLYYDDVFDASTTCTVARRASVSQGRALWKVWEKSFASALSSSSSSSSSSNSSASIPSSMIGLEPGHKKPEHYGPTFAYLCRQSRHLTPTVQNLQEVLFIFLFSHVKAILSAAVRQSLIGPYVAQAMLASNEVRSMVVEAGERGRLIDVEEGAGQCVPTLDLYQGRHEVLYSRVFNS